MLLLLLAACLFDRATYEARLAELTDNDGDGSSEVDGDCDDDDPTVVPGGGELCNGVDDDCDGEVDDDDDLVGADWFVDGDGDGFGSGSAIVTCAPSDSLVAVDGDCDDADSATAPGAAEACNGEDDDCNEVVDDPDTVAPLAWYPDQDGDGYGNGNGEPIASCADPGSASLSVGDCDDADRLVNPAADETCNGVDDDCNGVEDDAPAVTWYLDRDNDGYGDDDTTYLVCSPPPGYSAAGGDCDDLTDRVHPGASEVCEDGADEDCDGLDLPCGIPSGEADADDVSAWFTGQPAEPYVARTVGSAGDLDGDGDDELIVARPGLDALAGEVRLIAGQPTLRLGEHPLDSTGAALSGSIPGAAFGTALSGGLDVSGDGTPDLLVASYYDSRVWLFTQGASLLAGGFADEDATVELPGPSGDSQFGLSVALLGDIDDDGFGDWAVGDPEYDNERGAAFLYYGDGAAGVREVNGAGVVTLTGITALAAGGHEVASLGDLDGDGILDWGVGDNTTGAGEVERAFIFLGSRTRLESGMLEAADSILMASSADEEAFGVLVGVQDLDGDGRTDLATSSPEMTGGAGVVYILLSELGGPESGTVSAVAQATWQGEDPAQGLAAALAGPGDLDGDGYAELVAASSRTDSDGGALYVLDGRTTWGAAYDTSDASVMLSGANNDAEGEGIAGVLDHNGDNANDLLLSAWRPSSALGEGWFLYGAR